MKQPVYFLSLLFFAMISLNSFAQISTGGTPRSFDQSKAALFDVKIPEMQMTSVDVNALRAEDALVDQYKDRPWRFGENLYVDLDVKSDGVRTILPDGSSVYRLAVYSPEALSINLTFDDFQIPDGAEMFVYTAEKDEVIGAFTSANNQQDRVFATTLLFSEKIIIEYYEPAIVSFPGSVHLYRVTHGYRGPGDFMKAFGSSGSCQVNAACSIGTSWDDQIKSACMLVSGGSGFCSGSLVNNTANDGTPYILTANHCYSSPSGWVFWFNWQSATCANPGSSPSYNSISGATLKARSATSDFCLVQMNSTPPAGYGVYYAGWNRRTTAPSSGVTIHHPSGDIKKITDAGSFSIYDNYDAGNGPADCWLVNWAGAACTEGGSSGSPVFDENHLVVGQLYGGPSACGSANMYDYYGRFHVSWSGDATSATRLSDWLDPANTNPTTLLGYDPNAPTTALDAQVSSITSPSGSTCGSNSITPTVVLRNAGTTTLTSATVYYRIDSGTPVSQAWSGSLATGATTTITFPATTASYASHTIDSWTSAPNGGSDENLVNDTASATFSLNSGVINTFPWTEGFENGGSIPSCWTQTNVTGTLNWQFITGVGGGSPAAAHGGTYNASFYEGAYGTNNQTKLITPSIDFTGFSSATLSFWHCQRYWDPDQDTLQVYYRTSTAGSWVLLQTYSAGVTSWTQRTITLPNISSDYYIAFEGTEMYGYGIGLDDINVTAVASATITTGTISGSPFCAGAAVSVPFTISGTFNAGNVFTAQLSDAAGSFASPVAIGTLTGTTAGTINATIPAGATAGTGYRIRVVGSDPVVNGIANTSDITINTVPAQPSSITGDANPCQSATGLTYSVTNVTGVSYNWTVPSGWSITAGQGSNSATVSASATSGTITVTPSNSCGNGTAQTLSVTPVTVPAVPSSITGSATPCESSSQSYSVTNVAGTTYTWSFPSGWSQTAGGTTNSVTATVGSTSGTISVTPSNSCGSGTAQTLSVTPSLVPAQPSAITGDASPCQNTTGLSYSVTNVTGVTYTWSVPSGWSITAGQSSNSITVSAGPNSGTISVTPSNACGNGTAQSLSVTPDLLPAQPSISGSLTPCQGSTTDYSVSAVAGESYTWDVPSGWTINSGAGTNSINVTVGANSGNVMVVAQNACGFGTPDTISVIASVLPVQPSAISGNATPCDGSSQTYSVTNVAGITYTWSFPTGWTQTAGGTTNSVTVTVGAQSGTVSVTPSNGCGSGSAQTLSVNLAANPTVSLGADTAICDDQSITLDAGSGFSSYLWSTSAVSQTLNFDGATAGLGFHNITVTVTNAEGCQGSDMITIEVVDCTGLTESGSLQLTVYPNPAQNEINLQFSQSAADISIRLFDAEGRMVYQSANANVASGEILTIPFNELSNGVYTLRVQSLDDTDVRRIIKY